jgi:hypothetical protein
VTVRSPTPYETIADLAERELALVSALQPEQLVELADLARERDALIATLPPVPPAEARPALARAAYLQERTTGALTLMRDDVARALAGAARSRRAARGYGATLPSAHHGLDRSA